MDISFERHKNCLVVNVLGDIDHHFADLAKTAIDNEAKKEGVKNIVFNLSHVDFMDSAGIGMIIGRYKYTLNKGGLTAVVGLSENLKKIMMLSGLYRIIKIYDSVEDAAKAV